MTELPEGSRCRWCGRRMPPAAATGRPRRYCRRSCRQRDYESRRRAAELGLGESELVMARGELEDLKDKLYVLETAIEDVERDLAESDAPADVRAALEWLLTAARPLTGRVLA